MINQAFGVKCITCTLRAKTHRDCKLRQPKNKVKSMLSISFEFKGIVYKKIGLEGQRVNYAYCCHILRRLLDNVRRLHPEL
jgi:hypothetical protein